MENMELKNSLFLNDAEIIFNKLSNLNKKFSGQKILLTGASGFLGVNFLNYFSYLNNSNLLNKPCSIFAFDSFLRAPPFWFNQLINTDKNINLTKKNILDIKRFPDVDYVIHAASIASPTFYKKYPLETIDANVNGIRNILDFYKKKKINGILYFSTSEVYGDPDKKNIPTKESYNGNVSTIGPRACYDESKRLGETLCVSYLKLFNLPIKIVRPFNNYGPGLNINDKRVIPDFFKNIFKNQNITMYSKGNDTRTFCYITDAIDGYIRVLLKGKNGEPYNIGTARPEISISKLAKLISKIDGNNKKILFKKNPDKSYLKDNPKRRCPNISKAKKELSFKPSVGLKMGLKKTYEFYKFELNNIKK